MKGSLLGLSLILVSGLLAIACDSDDPGEQIPLLTARTGDGELQYHDLGSNTVAATEDTVITAPVWVMIYGVNDDGSLTMVEGQRSIFDVRPGEPGYSDLWQVITVTVPEDYEPNEIRSFDEVRASNYPVETLDMFVNCPIVPEGTSIENGPPLATGWIDGEDVYYFDFGLAPATIGEAWVLVDGEGDSTASEQIVEFDSGPDGDVVSPFRRLSVFRVTEGSEIASVAEARAANLEPESTGTVRNMPISTEDHASPPASTPYGQASPAGWALRTAIYAIIAIGGLAIVGALVLSRARR